MKNRKINKLKDKERKLLGELKAFASDVRKDFRNYVLETVEFPSGFKLDRIEVAPLVGQRVNEHVTEIDAGIGFPAKAGQSDFLRVGEEFDDAAKSYEKMYRGVIIRHYFVYLENPR